jgi:hypothetical protein
MVYRMSWFNSLSKQADEAALYGVYLYVWYTTWSAAAGGHVLIPTGIMIK